MSTTLNALVAKVGSDVSGLRSGLKLAKSDIGRTARIMQQAKTDADRFREAASSLHKSLRSGHITAQQYAAGLKLISQKYLTGPAEARRVAEETRRKADEDRKAAEAARQHAEANKRLQQGIATLAREEQQREALLRKQGDMLRALRKDTDAAASANIGLNSTLAGVAATYLSFQGAKSALKIASDMEQASISFEVMAGSAEKGKQVLDDLRQFAASTPITFSGAQQSAQTLMAFGIEAEKVVPTLRMLGDVSGGNQERFKMLSLAFAQMSAAGRLMGQDLLQMVNAGFNPLQEISRKTGVSLIDLKKQMEAGAISSQMVIEAFQSATGEGGRFFGMMDRMGQTALGAYNQLISAVQELVAQMGAFVLPALASVAKAVERLVRSFSSLVIPVNKTQAQWGALVVGFSSALIVIPKLISIIKSVIVAIRAMTTAQITMMAFTGPKGWAIIAASAGVAALAVIGVNKAFAEQTKEMEKASESAKGLADAHKETAKAVGRTADELARIEQMEDFSAKLGRMRVELAALRMGEKGEIFLAKTDALAAGATMEQADELEKLMKERKAIEKAREEEQKRLDVLEKQRDAIRDMMQRGQDLMQKHNPAAAVASQLADIQVLLRVGAINEATFYRERARILRENTKDIGQSQSPQAIEAGSQEAINFITDRMNQKQDQAMRIQMEQKTLQESQLAANQETNRLLAEMGIFKRAR